MHVLWHFSSSSSLVKGTTRVKFSNPHNVWKLHNNGVYIDQRQPKQIMGLIGNACFKGTPGISKHCSGLPTINPGGPLNFSNVNEPLILKIGAVSYGHMVMFNPPGLAPRTKWSRELIFLDICKVTQPCKKGSTNMIKNGC